MNNNFLKRLISSIILIPTIILIVIEGKLIFITFLFFGLILSIYELSKISFSKLIFFFGFFYLTFSFYCIFQIRNFYPDNNLNLFNFMFILILCISTDIGGFIVGRTIKGPKLTKISPNKTISGSLGSYITSIIAIYFYLKYSDFIFQNSKIMDVYITVIILIISSISQIGDILISFLKRKARLKDTGKIIPGHGGLLDRIDGIIFAFPFFYILIDNNLI